MRSVNVKRAALVAAVGMTVATLAELGAALQEARAGFESREGGFKGPGLIRCDVEQEPAVEPETGGFRGPCDLRPRGASCGVEQEPAPENEPLVIGCMPAPREPVQQWTTAVAPKPLSGQVNKGLDWLVRSQNDDGGWGQGEESRHMGAVQDQVDRSNVADTCIAALALIRSGSTPAAGPFAASLARAVDFVCGKIEASDAQSLYVTDVRGTRVQSKIGTYIDTFLSSMVLAELKGRCGDPARDARLEAALAKVLDKIERNQRADGGWEGQGWAPILAQSMAGKGLNRALQAGMDVDAEVYRGASDFFVGYAQQAESSPAAAGSAGVSLYSKAASLGGLQDSVNSGARREKELRQVLATSKDEDERKDAVAELDRIEIGKQAQEAAQQSMIGRLDDQGFVSGFGSNGGEEFLSYMNISESLVVRADDEWKKWDAGISANLERVQNGDGSWSGHHCITGRTFCTSAALLVLMADRTPVPVEMVAAVR